jgi:hypothetical protein
LAELQLARWSSRSEKEREERIEERERRADRWAHHLVASTSPKPPNKTVRWPNMNGFESWVAVDVWF